MLHINWVELQEVLYYITCHFNLQVGWKNLKCFKHSMSSCVLCFQFLCPVSSFENTNNTIDVLDMSRVVSFPTSFRCGCSGHMKLWFYFGGGKHVVLDSSFFVLDAFITLRHCGPFGCALIKKHWCWPTHVPGREIKNHVTIRKLVQHIPSKEHWMSLLPKFGLQRAWLCHENDDNW